MARRKRPLLDDDDDDDSSGGSDGGDFEVEDSSPYQRKRPRRSRGFLDDDDDDDFEAGPSKNRKKTDWTRAPDFVSGVKLNLQKSTMNGDSEDDSADEDDLDEQDVQEAVAGTDSSEDEVEAEAEQNNSPPPNKSTLVNDDFETERPRIGGIGSRPKRQVTNPTSNQSPSFTGIGIPPPAAQASSAPPVAKDAFPSAFGAARTQRSFLRESSNSTSSTKPSLSREESVHFNKLQGTFGARMLAKMGWETGTGLGATGEGIVTPIDQKMRPGKIGIAYRGFKEKTEQSKAEARRRGELPVEVGDNDENEDDPDFVRAKKKSERIVRSDAWKKSSKKLKTKVVSKTYEQILAEAGAGPPPSNVGKIIDATGAMPREVASMADLSLATWTPSKDPMRLPEIRHNLRLITDVCKKDVNDLAYDAKASDERKKYIEQEDILLRKKINEEAHLISRLQQVHLVADELVIRSKELSSAEDASLESFSPLFSKLLEQFPAEFDLHRLDELVVAAIAPLFRRLVAQWNPLDSHAEFITAFQSWGPALRINVVEENLEELEVDFYGERPSVRPDAQSEKPMTACESLLWNVWLPKVRSCINNDWSPQDPHPVVRLYEAWSPFLPAFIRDNLLDQLILPKVQRAVEEWSPRKDTSPLHTLIFPWLPHVGLRLESFLADAKRKVKSLLRLWVITEPIPANLIDWKEVFDAADWDAMLLQHIVPKLGATLRDNFRVNPRNQDMVPIQNVLVWSGIVRPSVFSQLLETHFFTKWLDVLHFWLTRPEVNLVEVDEWYRFWKKTFPNDVRNMPRVSHGFTRGLHLMNRAMDMEPAARAHLPHPDHDPDTRPPQPAVTSTQAQPNATHKGRSARTYEITFRSIVEEFAASHNFLLVPTGRAHEKSRMPLFRVSRTVDGKGGLLIYILDDAVWQATDGEGYRAITLDDMVTQASRM